MIKYSLKDNGRQSQVCKLHKLQQPAETASSALSGLLELEDAATLGASLAAG